LQHDSNNQKFKNQHPGIINKIIRCPDSNKSISVTDVPQMTDSHTSTTNAQPALKTSEIIHLNKIKIKTLI